MAKKSDKEEVIVDVKEVYTKTELFVDRNRKTLTMVLGALILVIIAFSVYRYMVVLPAENNAAQDSWKAEQYFEMDSLDLAISGDGIYDGLEGVVYAHSGTKAASRANYELGIINRDRGNFEDAIAYFQEADLGDEVVGALALGNIGDCFVELGDVQEGANWFEKAVAKAKGTNAESFTAPIMHAKAGIAYMELGVTDKASDHFEAIVENYPSSTEFGKAQRYLSKLGNK
ncbi:MAG: tetratricopeptide repeat protein [Flavobacteriales bacterium]|nr:tetratricopeptide repeat protein [Flavobacteriales bacterium]MDG1779986.1 tetratricopeptide repeat protein [Flavobacteriales bacterium]